MALLAVAHWSLLPAGCSMAVGTHPLTSGNSCLGWGGAVRYEQHPEAGSRTSRIVLISVKPGVQRECTYGAKEKNACR